MKIWSWRIRRWIDSVDRIIFGGWIPIVSKVYRRENNLPCWFEDWLYKECKIKKQTSYNFENLHKLMSVALKLMNCRGFLLKTMKFFSNILKKMKNRSLGNMGFLVHAKIVFLTLLENKAIICTSKFLWLKL